MDKVEPSAGPLPRGTDNLIQSNKVSIVSTPFIANQKASGSTIYCLFSQNLDHSCHFQKEKIVPLPYGLYSAADGERQRHHAKSAALQ
jgi:hypothetical protein